MQALIAPRLSPLDAATVDDLCKRLGAESNTRYTVILPSGVVVGDTWETPANMDNHAARPEVAGALARGAESSRRFSTTLQRNVLYVASSVHDQGRPVAVVRAAIPLSRMEEELDRLRSRFVGIGALIAGLALAVTLALSQRYGRKVRELQEAAARLAEGDLSQRLPAPDSEELAGLAESFNRMAAQIESRMQEVVRQRNQLEVVLSSMQEGVIAVDREERVISLNPAAALLVRPAARSRPGPQPAGGHPQPRHPEVRGPLAGDRDPRRGGHGGLPERRAHPQRPQHPAPGRPGPRPSGP